MRFDRDSINYGRCWLAAGFIICFLLLSCTGPQLFVSCYNETDLFESFYLKRTTGDESFVEVVEPRGKGLINIQIDGEFQWIIRLYDEDAEVHADSGDIAIDRDHLCTVEPDTAGMYVVTWEQ